MKQIIFLTSFIIACLNLAAQNARKDATGNYVAIQTLKDSTAGKPSGQTYTDSQGIVYPVMISKNGKLFVVRISKIGTQYKYYLKLD
jgi:hypothetical protein